MDMKMINLDLRGFDEREKALIEEFAARRQLAETVKVAMKDYIAKLYPVKKATQIWKESDILAYLARSEFDRWSVYRKSLYLNNLKEELKKGIFAINPDGSIEHGLELALKGRTLTPQK
jgi:hypothetical protein